MDDNNIKGELKSELMALSRSELDMSRIISKVGVYCTAIIGIGSMVVAMAIPTIPMVVIAIIATYYSSRYSVGSEIIISVIDEIIAEYDK
jgi:hypothetical protein